METSKNIEEQDQKKDIFAVIVMLVPTFGAGRRVVAEAESCPLAKMISVVPRKYEKLYKRELALSSSQSAQVMVKGVDNTAPLSGSTRQYPPEGGEATVISYLIKINSILRINGY